MNRNSAERGDDVAHTQRDDAVPRHPARVGDIDLLSTEELERLEAQSDPLIDLVGHHELRSPKSKAFDDPRFVEWLAREARVEHARRPDRDALNPDEVRSLAHRIRARMRAERFGVRNDDTAASVMQERPSRPVSQFVEELRGTARAAVLSLGVAAGVGRELWDAPVDSWVQIPDDLPHGRYLALTVSGDSMSPLMHTGDTVLVRLGPDVTPDTVIVALVPDHGYVVKCVGRVTARSIELVSLNREFAPVRVARERSTVLGTVVLRWCGHRHGSA